MNPLLRWLLLLIGTASLLPGRARAEGLKQLTPNTTGTTTVLSDPTNTRPGYLSHDVNIAGAGVTRSGAELPQAVRLRLQRRGLLRRTPDVRAREGR